MRRNFAEVLKDMRIDISKEYEKLWDMFFDNDVYENINENFNKLWFSDTYLSLEEFNTATGFDFREKKKIKSNEIDYFVSFCEYVYNIIIAADSRYLEFYGVDFSVYIRRIFMLVEKIGYVSTQQDSFTIFVEKSPSAISVAEITPKDIAVNTLSYNHHSMKGNLFSKKNALKLFADYLEPKRRTIESVNSKFANSLFYAFNNFNIRHNNVDPENKNNYKKFIADMAKDDLEKLYDETYQMCLLAILQIDNKQRTKYINEIKEKIEEIK